MAETRKNPGNLRTGDDRNAYGITAGGSRYDSAMERGESVVRAILTVSILILALHSCAFKGDFLQVQRKYIRQPGTSGVWHFKKALRHGGAVPLRGRITNGPQQSCAQWLPSGRRDVPVFPMLAGKTPTPPRRATSLPTGPSER